ncbi:hypothetical protein [Moraxella lacunata]
MFNFKIHQCRGVLSTPYKPMYHQGVQSQPLQKHLLKCSVDVN